uniref:(northern house mosquito) hypothetical protein n=1 Tax=Culex pipiens TaxID=7175 RepID=A0A8D8BX29_CULPI
MRLFMAPVGVLPPLRGAPNSCLSCAPSLLRSSHWIWRRLKRFDWILSCFSRSASVGVVGLVGGRCAPTTDMFGELGGVLNLISVGRRSWAGFCGWLGELKETFLRWERARETSCRRRFRSYASSEGAVAPSGVVVSRTCAISA